MLVSLVLLGAVTFQSDATIEDAIVKKIGTLRSLPDIDRVKATKDLALEIRKLHIEKKSLLASMLANLSTEGDFGRDTLQEVTTTLALSVREKPIPLKDGQPDFAYSELAALSKYEGMKVDLNDPAYIAAKKLLDATDLLREKATFSLTDIKGQKWSLSSLKGKVVLVNFWATWCPPCRKEMPDIQALYEKFKDKGFVVLAISDETMDKVDPFIKEKGYNYTVLLDPGRKVNDAYKVDGIPKNFVYNREGKLVAQSIDMRTKDQFLKMLAKAGLK